MRMITPFEKMLMDFWALLSILPDYIQHTPGVLILIQIIHSYFPHMPR